MIKLGSKKGSDYVMVDLPSHTTLSELAKLWCIPYRKFTFKEKNILDELKEV